MRIDKFLQVTGLIKRRVLACEACKRGLISINGLSVKQTREILPGDEILIDLPKKSTRIRVIAEPPASLSKARRNEIFEIMDVTVKASTDHDWDED